jgi:GH15 family glucan-1,4-alpha-glucosidase
VPPSAERVPRIRDYGLIGDSRSTALVSRYGSVEWLCWPRFDSPSIFAAILDREKGGHWSIAPTREYEVERGYIENSNVLETRFVCPSGKASLIDLMPVSSEEYKRKVLVPYHELLRELRCTSGEIEVEIDFFPRPDYGSKAVQIRAVGGLGLRMEAGDGACWLRGSVPLNVQSDRAGATVVLKQGEVLRFSLSYTETSPAVLPVLGKATEEAIERSVQWWQQWAAVCKYQGPYRDAVLRSALALKCLAYAPSGAVIAAATTSLPERIGDSLNWDYRYCWLRDASLTIRALLGLGYYNEAASFLTWMLHTTRLTHPGLSVMYTVFGRLTPREQELKHLRGYFDSAPVRIGNAARKQLQLDIYGETVEATAQYAEYADFFGSFDQMTQRTLIALGKYVAKNWDQPDEGIWEPRYARENHTHSRLMCWTALDRLLALDEKGKLKGVPREWFTRERDRIRQQIESRAWNAKMQSYVSVLDGNELDSTLLRLDWYGFEHADSDRMISTYERVREKLGAGKGLLYRYRRSPGEGTFGVCAFWGVEHLALAGRLDEAHETFQQLLGYQNDLGLFAEEIDPESGDALGNFPQAFTHVGLISAALTIAEQERGKAHPAVRTGSDVKTSPAEAQS